MSERVIILGGGESGVGAAILAKKQGFEVFLSDNKSLSFDAKDELTQASIDFEEAGHSTDKILKADLVVKSPGIPGDIHLISKIKEAGIELVSEIEFASRFTKAKIIAITGTNGKTTTTLLTYHLLQEAGLDVEIAGNIGFGFARKLSVRDYDYFVLEVSSFQLDDILEFTPDIAVILNITPDHLDRYHGSMEQYAASKVRITENQNTDDYLLYFGDDFVLDEALAKAGTGATKVNFGWGENGGFGANMTPGKLSFDLKEKFDLEENELPLIGKHNKLNIMAAVSAASLMGVQYDDITKGLKTFKNASHRLEPIAEVAEVSFINDSKATNVDAVYYALEGVTSGIVWIAGGVDKGNNYQTLMPFIKNKKVKSLVCLGTDNQALTNVFGGLLPIREYNTMSKAVSGAFEVAKPGDTVLLSPACASFDLFKSYADRGDQFRAEVLELKDKTNSEKKNKE